jgi:hypothetical protein
LKQSKDGQIEVYQTGKLYPERAADPDTDAEPVNTPRRASTTSLVTNSSPAQSDDSSLSSYIHGATPSSIATPDTVYSFEQTRQTLDLADLCNGVKKLTFNQSSTSTAFAFLPNEIIKKIVRSLDDPRDIARLSMTCRKHSIFIKAREQVFAMEMAYRQEPIARVVLENLYFDWYERAKTPRYPKLGLAWIKDGITRSDNISKLVTRFEAMGLLAKYRQRDAVLPHKEKMLQVLRKQLSTVLLGAEICAIKFGTNSLNDLLSDSQRTVTRALVQNAACLSVLWMVGLGLTRMKADGSTYVPPDSEKGRILGDLLTGSLSFGASFMNQVLDCAPATTRAMRKLLDAMAGNFFTMPTLAVQKNIIRMEFRSCMIDNVKTRALVRAFLGTMKDWKREIQGEDDWEETIREIGWSVPMTYTTLEEREKHGMFAIDSAGSESSRILPLWFAMMWPGEC